MREMSKRVWLAVLCVLAIASMARAQTDIPPVLFTGPASYWDPPQLRHEFQLVVRQCRGVIQFVESSYYTGSTIGWHNFRRTEETLFEVRTNPWSHPYPWDEFGCFLRLNLLQNDSQVSASVLP
jgi:hypothetical protein